MIGALVPLGAHLLRRNAESVDYVDNETGQVPAWAVVLFVLDVIILIPIFFLIVYALASVYTTLTIIEMPAPPPYEALATNDLVSGTPFSDEDNGNNSRPKVPPKDNHVSVPVAGESSTAATFINPQDKPLYTTSIRRIYRLLVSNSGRKSNFRGVGLYLLRTLVVTILVVVFQTILPLGAFFLGSLLASLLTVQLSTAWTHRIISSDTSGTRSWLRKLPPYMKTLKATYIPILVHWAAEFVAAGPSAFVLDSRVLRFAPDNSDRRSHMQQARAPILLFLWMLLIHFLVIYPAEVALVRVQASLLPAGEETIVPFDRTFGGQVVPMALGGDGYVGFSLALKTFSWSSWIRLYKLVAKVVSIVLVLYCTVAGVVWLQLVVIRSMLG